MVIPDISLHILDMSDEGAQSEQIVGQSASWCCWGRRPGCECWGRGTAPEVWDSMTGLLATLSLMMISSPSVDHLAIGLVVKCRHDWVQGSLPSLRSLAPRLQQ